MSKTFELRFEYPSEIECLKVTNQYQSGFLIGEFSDKWSGLLDTVPLNYRIKRFS